jgi:hypothetical protein
MWFRKNNKKRPAWRPPELTEARILAWADAFREQHGRWWYSSSKAGSPAK